jgi:hypothetical protein
MRWGGWPYGVLAPQPRLNLDPEGNSCILMPNGFVDGFL